jgi:hypothetical protein
MVLQEQPSDERAQRLAAVVMAGVCFLCSALGMLALLVDMCLPPPWGGMAADQPWEVGSLTVLLNLPTVCCLIHLLPWQRIGRQLASLAGDLWRDFCYWTVGDPA